MINANYDPDYVFDGTSPPYPPSANPNPINSYGHSKRDGELAILGVTGLKGCVLRVPVLYAILPYSPTHLTSDHVLPIYQLRSHGQQCRLRSEHPREHRQ